MDVLGFLFGNGAANNASKELQMKNKYDEALVNAQMRGESLPPYEEWVKLQTGQMNAGQPYKAK